MSGSPVQPPAASPAVGARAPAPPACAPRPGAKRGCRTRGRRVLVVLRDRNLRIKHRFMRIKNSTSSPGAAPPPPLLLAAGPGLDRQRGHIEIPPAVRHAPARPARSWPLPPRAGVPAPSAPPARARARAGPEAPEAGVFVRGVAGAVAAHGGREDRLDDGALPRARRTLGGRHSRRMRGVGNQDVSCRQAPEIDQVRHRTACLVSESSELSEGQRPRPGARALRTSRRILRPSTQCRLSQRSLTPLKPLTAQAL